MQLTPSLTFSTDYDIFWRMQKNDGIYATNLSLIYPGSGVSSLFIGTQLSVALDYSPNNYFTISIEGTWFDAGDFIKESGTGKDIIFTALTAQLKF